MSGQTQVRKPARDKDVDVTEHLANEGAQQREDAQATKDAMDALLDEIDEVLEENAAELAMAYRQKGGQ